MMVVVLLSLSGLLSLMITDGSGTDTLNGAARGDIMGEWEQLPGGGWPSSISTDDCFIFTRDQDNEMVVIHRGDDDYETWSFFEDNETWIRWNTSGDDPSRSWSNKAFTSNTNGSIAYLYGGYRQSSAYWEDLNILFYDNMTWMEVAPHPNLGARYWSEMIYDDTTESIWIFGGRESSARQSDLFQYNFTHGWTEHTAIDIEDEERDQMLMTISPDGEDIYMAIGRLSGWGGGGTWHTDIWHYDVVLQNWTEINDDLGIPTDGGAVFQYRADTDDLFLSLGFSGNTELNNTYIIDPLTGNATQVNLTGGIPGRHVQAWDMKEDGRTAIIFGDDDGAKDIWAMDLYTYSTYLTEGNLAWAGGTAFTGYDPEDGGKLMTLKHISGSYWQLVYFSLASEQWNSMYVSTENAPTYHDGMANTYDPINNLFYLYGGVYWYEISNDWYAYHYSEFSKLDCDTGEWTIITEDSMPGERGRATLTFDEENNHLYLFGGQIEGGDTDSLWRYNISSNAWKSYVFTIGPQPRREHSVTFDQEGDRFFMFGGRRNGTSTAELDDLWTFDVNQDQWQKMPDGSDSPTLQNWAGLSYNSDTRELLLMGDKEDEDMFLWREEWFGWQEEEAVTNPGDWSGHGQVYSPLTRMHYAWAHDGTEVWEYKPILRTTAQIIKMIGTDGEYMVAPPGQAVKVFPTAGTYKIEVTGITDLPQNDLIGLDFNISGMGDIMQINWTELDGIVSIGGNETWFEINGTPTLEWTSTRNWKFTIPFFVLYGAPNAANFNFKIVPVTNIGLAERSQRLSIFQVKTDLEVTGYHFSTPLQSTVVNGEWLYGNTDLTVSNFSVTFVGEAGVSPEAGNFRITMTSSSGDSSFWDYMPDEEGSITIPINGTDSEQFLVWLNLTTLDGELVQSKLFSFNIDLDPPTAPEWVKVRADSTQDETVGVDNDNEIYLTWGPVIENGSGLKGICYSMDVNLWPAEVNLTNEFPKITIHQEGAHTFYVWALDNTLRGGPVVEAEMIIDTHMVFFASIDPDPTVQINTTKDTFTFTVTIMDDLSGVDLDSIQYQQSLPDRSLSEWEDINVTANDINNVTFALTVDLVSGIKNIVGVRATDLAENEIRVSDKYGIYCNPGLATPQAVLGAPENGKEVLKTVKLTWEGGFINPMNLSFEVHVMDPKGTEFVFDLEEVSYDFDPVYPGIHQWWIVSRADGMTNQTEKRTFTFIAPLVEVSTESQYSGTEGQEIAVTLELSNPLVVSMNLTLSIDDSRGFTLAGGGDQSLLPGEEDKEGMIAIGTNGVAPGTYSLELNLTDEYGRSKIVSFSVVLEPLDDGGSDIVNDTEDTPLALIAAIGVIVLLIVIVAIIFFRKKGKEEEEVEEEEEEKEISLDYDPTGVVAEGGTGANVNVPLAPGMLGDEEQRKSGSNVIEITIPSKDEDVGSGVLKEEEGTEPPEEIEELDEMEEE